MITDMNNNNDDDAIKTSSGAYIYTCTCICICRKQISYLNDLDPSFVLNKTYSYIYNSDSDNYKLSDEHGITTHLMAGDFNYYFIDRNMFRDQCIDKILSDI